MRHIRKQLRESTVEPEPIVNWPMCKLTWVSDESQFYLYTLHKTFGPTMFDYLFHKSWCLFLSISSLYACMPVCVYFKHPHESTCRCRCKLYGFQYLSFCRRGILFYLIHPLANVMLMKSYQTSCIHVAKLISIVCIRFNRMTTNRCASGCIFKPFVHVSQSPVSNGQCLNLLFISLSWCIATRIESWE